MAGDGSFERMVVRQIRAAVPVSAPGALLARGEVPDGTALGLQDATAGATGGMDSGTGLLKWVVGHPVLGSFWTADNGVEL